MVLPPACQWHYAVIRLCIRNGEMARQKVGYRIWLPELGDVTDV